MSTTTMAKIKSSHWRIQGGRQGRTASLNRGQNSFIFMQFSAKNCKIIGTLGVGAPSGKSWIRHWLCMNSAGQGGHIFGHGTYFLYSLYLLDIRSRE